MPIYDEQRNRLVNLWDTSDGTYRPLARLWDTSDGTYRPIYSRGGLFALGIYAASRPSTVTDGLRVYSVNPSTGAVAEVSGPYADLKRFDAGWGTSSFTVDGMTYLTHFEFGQGIHRLYSVDASGTLTYLRNITGSDINAHTGIIAAVVIGTTVHVLWTRAGSFNNTSRWGVLDVATGSVSSPRDDITVPFIADAMLLDDWYVSSGTLYWPVLDDPPDIDGTSGSWPENLSVTSAARLGDDLYVMHHHGRFYRLDSLTSTTEIVLDTDANGDSLQVLQLIGV